MSIADHSGSEEGSPKEILHPSKPHEPGDNSSNIMRGAADSKAQEGFNDLTKAKNNPENRITEDTAGRRNFGECAINDVKMCGKNQDTAVELRNGLAEKILTRTQSWERDSKNPRIWNITEGNENYSLKADVKIEGNDLKANVKYENGREIGYKNGEPSEIKHPNGESWKPDPKHPGRWDVTVPNKDDLDHPKRFSIQDVKVDAKTGNITWHVDRGAGKGQDRGIDAHNEYHARLNGVSLIPGERTLEPHAAQMEPQTAPMEPNTAHLEPHAAHLEQQAAKSQAPQEQRQEHKNPLETPVMAKLDAAASSNTEAISQAPKAKEFFLRLNRHQSSESHNPKLESEQKHSLQHLESLQPVPKAERVEIPQTASGPEQSKAASSEHLSEIKPEIPLAKPHEPKFLQHTEAKAPLPEQTNAPLQKIESAAIPHPEPLISPKSEIPRPSPHAPEHLAIVQPHPMAPHLDSTLKDKVPAPVPHKVEALNLERIAQDNLARVKEMQERMSRASEQIAPSLQKIAVGSLPIPMKPVEQIKPYSLPVVQAALLEGPRLTNPLPMSHPHVDSAAPIVLLRNELSTSPAHTFEPRLKNESYNKTPVPEIQSISNSAASEAPSPVPMNVEHHSADNKAPLPRRAEHANSAPVFVQPSMGRAEQAAAHLETNSKIDSKAPNENTVKENTHEASTSSMTRQANQQSVSPFQLGAEMQSERQHSPTYDGGVDYSTYKPQFAHDASAASHQPLRGNADAQSHRQSLHGSAEHRLEAHFALAGNGTYGSRNWTIDPKANGVEALRPDAPLNSKVTLTCHDGSQIIGQLGPVIRDNQNRIVGRVLQIGNYTHELKVERT